MVFVLKGLAGPYIDKYFKIGLGTTIGRRQGDILLDADSAVSSTHGRVVTTSGGGLAIQDAGSQNQFLVFGKKTAQVELAAGVVFQVGQSTFQVMAVLEKDLATMNIERSWKDIVFETLENNKMIGASQAKSFSPTVRIECIAGPSAETSWFLGFGPRQFGPLCPDIEFLEKDAADVAFEIFQSDSGPAVKSMAGQNLLINRQSISEKTLEHGDQIQVGSTVFKVHLGS